MTLGKDQLNGNDSDPEQELAAEQHSESQTVNNTSRLSKTFERRRCLEGYASKTEKGLVSAQEPWPGAERGSETQTHQSSHSMTQ